MLLTMECKVGQLSKALPMWKDWLLLVHEQLQLCEVDGVLEYCVLCAALITTFKGVHCYWVEELYNRIQIKLAHKRFERHMSLHCGGYLGLVCHHA